MTLTYLDTQKGVLLLKKESQFIFPKFNLMSEGKGLKNFKGRLETCIKNTKNQTGIILLDPIFKGIVNISETYLPFSRDVSYFIFSATKYSGFLDKSGNLTPCFVDKSDLPRVLTSIYAKQIYEWLQDGRMFAGNLSAKGNEIDAHNSFVDFFNFSCNLE